MGFSYLQSTEKSQFGKADNMTYVYIDDILVYTNTTKTVTCIYIVKCVSADRKLCRQNNVITNSFYWTVYYAVPLIKRTNGKHIVHQLYVLCRVSFPLQCVWYICQTLKNCGYGIQCFAEYWKSTVRKG